MTNPNNWTPSQALQKRLEILAGMISLGEKIAWGSDSALMLEAATMLAAKDEELAAKQVQVKIGSIVVFRGESFRAVCNGDTPGTFDLHVWPSDRTGRQWRNVPADKLKLSA